MIEALQVLCVSPIIEANCDTFRVWFECWLTSYVPLLMSQTKWLSSDRKLVVGDSFIQKNRKGICKSVSLWNCEVSKG